MKRLAGVISLALACPFVERSSANGSTEANGISHQNYVVRSEPWSVQVVKIDRSKREYELTTSLGLGTRIGLGTLTEQLRRIPKQVGTPVAAINGDFYKTEGGEYSGDPRGLQILRGELVSGPTERTCFWVDTSGNPRMGDVNANFNVTWPSGEQTPFELNEERAASGTLYTPAAGRSTRTSGGIEFVLEAVDAHKWLPLQAGEKYAARVREIRRGETAESIPAPWFSRFPGEAGSGIRRGRRCAGCFNRNHTEPERSEDCHRRRPGADPRV